MSNKPETQEQGVIKPEDIGPLKAAHMANPNINHPALMEKLLGPLIGDEGPADIVELNRLVREQSQAIANGNTKTLTTLLATQVQTLNAMFVRYGFSAASHTDIDNIDQLLKLALRAQSQCRTTAEAISAIQNPPHATFVKQTNISNGAPQQVNNKQGDLEHKRTDPITTIKTPEAVTNG